MKRCETCGLQATIEFHQVYSKLILTDGVQGSREREQGVRGEPDQSRPTATVADATAGSDVTEQQEEPISVFQKARSEKFEQQEASRQRPIG